jgi:UDP-glucose 4-epimerase|tara:strand:- start:1768 stop:2676 length:909 start_codon:yes stop_codon:yes gene_type:complete
MKAVVFGGSGFLGSHVADALTAAGFQVVIFDCNKSPFLMDDQDMVVDDIMDSNQVMKSIKGADVVFHFAGVADIHKANENPYETVRLNVLGTTIILDACVKADVNRFIFASSVYVYSEHGGFYRSSKQACELLIENYNKLYDLNFTILRFGSLYGQRANESNWIYNVIKQALTEGRIQRKGDGEEIREYINVRDAAQACVDMTDDKYKNSYITLTGTQPIKIKDLMVMIREMLGNKVEIQYLDEYLEEHYEITPYSFRPNLAKKYVNNSQIDLGQGLLDMIYDVYRDVNGSEEKNLPITPPE